MINVQIIRDNKGFIWQFIVRGHAEYSDPGSDVVCAAVSVTAYTAAGALEDLAGLKNCYKVKDGYMMCSIPQDVSEEKKQIAGVILETTAIGFKQIELSYGDYVSVLDEEV